MRWIVPLLASVAACGDNATPTPDPYCDAWHQWGNGAGHTGASCAVGQLLQRKLADIVIDPFAEQEESLGGFPGGDLIIHYQVPLLDGDAVYAMTKGGTFTPCVPETDPRMLCAQPADLYRLNTQVWSEVRYSWQGDALIEDWSFDSDWKPEPRLFFEPMFQPALVGSSIAIPGAGGSVWRLDATTGEVRDHITPFGTSPDVYVAGAIAVDAGILYYNAIELDHDRPFEVPSSSWLVSVKPDGTVMTRSYAELVPGAPAANDLCYGNFTVDLNHPMALPPPPNPDGTPALPPLSACGSQMPGINSAPAFAFDGTLYVVTHAQYNENYSYIVSVNPGDLIANWATSLRGLVPEGCGLTIPYATELHPTTGCRPGTATGIDPNTGLPAAALVDDSSSSNPVALPSGGVIYGALTSDNLDRGELLKFDDAGHFGGRYGFGWDSTPAVVSDASGDRIVIKDNHYFGASPTDSGPFYLTELDEGLNPIWQYQNVETRSCERQPDGTLSCTVDHPNGFEWCVNAPAVDRAGTVYANSEDGNIYAISAGVVRSQFFLDKSLGAAYTPLSIDHAGRIYALNNGHMIVIGHY